MHNIKRWLFLSLFVFLSACGGGGSGDGGDTTPPSTNTAPSLSLSANAVTLDEDFGTFIINTTATDAEDGVLPVAVTGQDASLFAVTTSTDQIILTSVANANGIATLTVSIVDSGNLSASTEVVVVVNAVNDTPTLTFSTTQLSLNPNFMPQTIATATDVDDASLLLTFALSATDVVQITTVANRFILNPITNAFGETTITLTATDNSGNQSSQIFTVRVNGFPTLALSAQRITLDEDFGTFIINTTATDAEDGVLPVAVTGQDASLFAVTTSTDQIILTSVANANGIATLTVSIVDSGNLSASTEVVVVVNAVNDTPTLTFSTTQLSLNANFMPQTIATATDVDDASLLLTFALSATDVVQITTVANRFILNPITNAFGETTITLTATDNSGNQSSQIFTVRVNGFPTLALSAQRITLDEDFGTFIINTTATDVEDGVLPVAVTGQDASLFAVTTSTNQIMLTSVANANGTATLTVSIVDSGNLSASTEVVVIVNAVNDTPTLTFSTTQLSLNANFMPQTIATATDVDDASLLLTFALSATDVVQITTVANRFILNPITNAFGDTTITLAVSDDDGARSSSQIFTVRVNAPIASTTPTLALSTQNITLDEDFGTFIINTTATDAEDGTLSVTVSGQAGLLTTNATTDQITLTSVADANGTVTLNVRAVDSGDLAASTEVVVIINAVNDSPTLTLSTTNLSLSEDFGTFIINTTASDAEDGALLVTVSGQAGLLTTNATTDQITLTSIANVNGTTTLTVSATDSDAITVSTEVIVVVNAVNDSPTLTLSTTNLSLSEDFGTFIINTTASDAEDGVLSFTVSGQDASLLTVSTSINQIILTSVANANGTVTLTVSATDSDARTVTTEVAITINAINDTPTLTLATTNITIVENATARQTISITDVADVEGSTLTFSVIASTSVFSSNPTSVVSFSDTRMITFSRQSTTAQLYYTLRPDSTGTGFIQIALTDGIDTQVTTVTVTVTEVKNPPQITQDFRTHRFFDARATRVGAVGGVLFAARGVFTGSLVSSSTDGTGDFSNQLNFARSLGGSLAELYTEETYNALLGSVLVANGAATVGFDDDRFWLGLTEIPNTFGASVPDQSASDDRYFWLSGQRVSQGLGAARVDVPGVYIGWGASAPGSGSQPCADLILGEEVPVGFRPWANERCDGSSFAFFDALKALMQFPNGLPTTSSMVFQARSVITRIRLSGYDLDGSDNALSWQVTDASGGSITTSTVYSSTGAQTLEIAYTPVSNFSGTATLVVSLDDGDSATQNSTARVLVVNSTPTLTLSTNAVSLDEDFTSFVINTTASNAAGIIDFSVSTGNGIVLVTTSANAITLQSLPNINGTVTLTVVASSGLLTDTQTISVVVNPVNDTPTLSLSVTQRVLAQNFGTFVINTTATDVESGTLGFSVSTGNGIVNVTTSVNTITLQSLANVTGDVTLTVSVSDGLLTTTQSIFITVSRAVTLEISTNTIVLDEDFNTFIINTTATVADGSTLPISVLQSTPNLLAFSTITGRITLSSIANANGVTTLTVSATNQGGLTNTTEVAITINSINDTPTLSLSNTNLTLAPNSTGLITAFGADVETSSASLVYSVQQNPSLLQVSTQGNVIVLRSSATAGSTTLVITVTDGGNLSASATARVTVLSNVLNFALNVKRIDFSWNTSLTANHYRMLSNVDLNAGGGFVDASSASLVFVPNSTNIINTTVSAIVDVARYLSTANGPQYLLEACSSVDNSACANHALQTLSNAQLEGLIGYFKASNTGGSDQFGTALAISGDGNTLVVGAPFEDSTATGINGDEVNNNSTNTGAVYVFVRSSTGSWRQQAYVKASNTEANDRFGTAVSISDNGNTLIVGAFGEDSTATGINGDQLDNSASDSGAAYVFVRNSAGTWSQQAYLKASNTGAGDEFGRGVSISGDGNTLLISSIGEDSNATGINGDQTNNSTSNSGAAYVFVRSSTDSSWSQQAYIKASNTDAGDSFSSAVSVSDDGNTLVIGASFEDSTATGINGDQTTNSASASGAAYVFVRSSTDSSWSQQAYLKASNTGVNDQFGIAVSVSDDGNTLVVGALFEDSTATGINGNQTSSGANDSGAAYLFVRSSTGTWSQQAYIKASNTQGGDTFGNYVAISGDGNTFVVSAPNEDSNATGINGDQGNVSGLSNFGAAYLFVRSSTGTWSQQAYVKGINLDGFFGSLLSSVSMSDDGKTLATGAPNDGHSARGINGGPIDNNAGSSGAVYLY